MTEYAFTYQYPLTHTDHFGFPMSDRDFNLTVISADGFEGTVTWAGHEWSLPEESGKRVEARLSVGILGASFSPENFPFFLSNDEKIMFATPPEHTGYVNAMMKDMEVESNEFGYIADSDGNKYFWEQDDRQEGIDMKTAE